MVAGRYTNSQHVLPATYTALSKKRKTSKGKRVCKVVPAGERRNRDQSTGALKRAGCKLGKIETNTRHDPDSNEQLNF